MPATTKKTPETATKAVKTRKATGTAGAENTKRKKKVTIESADLVVVGPVAEIVEVAMPETVETPNAAAAPAVVFESGTRQSRIGNAFEVTLTGTGNLVVRYHDRASWFGPAMKAVVVSNPGRGETVAVIDLTLNGATHEGRIQLSPETATVALAFSGGGRWDSNESRNYQVNLKP